MNYYKFFLAGVVSICGTVVLNAASVSISIDGNGTTHKVSPYIYGKNNSTSEDSTKATTAEDWTRINESGVAFLRENGGNNSTKYNYRRHLSSHPDWYNNVEPHDWDYELGLIQEIAPQVQTMYGFQLLGQVAETEANNFKDWDWYVNHDKKWLNTDQNVAGSGSVPNPDDGETALTDGDPDSYLMPWPADSTVGILDHWFGEGGLGFDRSKVLYWAMDNEPEIWHGTHDDVQKEPVSADEFIDKYVSVAKAAKSKWPEIKLVGPITCNEWQWYVGSDGKGVTKDGVYYSWIEYFIKRIAEEEALCGMKLLDVFALHFYPSKLSDSEVVQCHRIYFDETYDYPQANGVKKISGKWDNSVTKEFVLKRCQDWMLKYMNEVRGVGITETGIESKDANVNSIWYGSTIGEFMKRKVEVFSPWRWKAGMWETLHLFARYNKPYYLDASSSNDSLVSVHATVNEEKDSLSVLLINRDLTESAKVEIDLRNFELQDGDYRALELSDLPAEETFVSHSVNALKERVVTFVNGKAFVLLPPLSTTTVLLSRRGEENRTERSTSDELRVWPTLTDNVIYVSGAKEKSVIQIISSDGKPLLTKVCDAADVSLDMAHLPQGYYVCAVSDNNVTKTFTVLKR